MTKSSIRLHSPSPPSPHLSSSVHIASIPRLRSLILRDQFPPAPVSTPSPSSDILLLPWSNRTWSPPKRRCSATPRSLCATYYTGRNVLLQVPSSVSAATRLSSSSLSLIGHQRIRPRSASSLRHRETVVGSQPYVQTVPKISPILVICLSCAMGTFPPLNTTLHPVLLSRGGRFQTTHPQKQFFTAGRYTSLSARPHNTGKHELRSSMSTSRISNTDKYIESLSSAPCLSSRESETTDLPVMMT